MSHYKKKQQYTIVTTIKFKFPLPGPSNTGSGPIYNMYKEEGKNDYQAGGGGPLFVFCKMLQNTFVVHAKVIKHRYSTKVP